MKSKTRTEYQADYHAKDPQRVTHRKECQRVDERLARFWAIRNLVYGSPLPVSIDPESRAYKQEAKIIRQQIKAGHF